MPTDHDPSALTPEEVLPSSPIPKVRDGRFQPGRRLALALVLLMVVGGVFWLMSRTPTVSRSHVKQEGKRQDAPDFALKDINGKTVRLSDYRGKVILLDFWATWCGPCQMEIPWFMDFERKYKDRGFAVLGLSMDDDGWQSVKPFIQEMRVNYRVMIADERTGELYGGIEALPTAFLIDREGRVADEQVGVSSRRDFEDGIEKLLEAPAGDKRAALN